MKALKGFENWTEVERYVSEKTGKTRVLYQVRNYRIAVVDADYLPGGIAFSVTPIDQSRYTPEIYVDARFGNAFQAVHIQTTSWGALEISEIDKVVKAYTEAQELAREIERSFPECFKIA